MCCSKCNFYQARVLIQRSINESSNMKKYWIGRGRFAEAKRYAKSEKASNQALLDFCCSTEGDTASSASSSESP